MAQDQEMGDSLFHVERISQYVSLSPSSLATPLPAVCAVVLSPLLLSWFPPARGVVLAYEDVELSSTPPKPQTASQLQAKLHSQSNDEPAPTEPLLLRHVDEYMAPFLWVTASFVIWRPQRNAHLTAVVTHQSKTHITLQYLNVFPVSILREHLPSDWTWYSKEAGKMKKGWDGRLADDGGWWLDGGRNKVKGSMQLRVRIRDFDGKMDGKARGKAFIRIEGSLLSVEEEKEKLTQKSGKGKEREKGTTSLVSNMVKKKKKSKDKEVNEESMEVD